MRTEKELKDFATQNFELCFGKTKKEIDEMMRNHVLSPQEVNDLVEILNTINEDEFTVVGSTALKMQGLLGRKINDLDIVIDSVDTINKLIIKLKLKEYDPRIESSQEFLMKQENVKVEKFILKSGRTLDVFILNNQPDSNHMKLNNSVSIKVETIESVIDAKKEYIRSANLPSDKLQKQEDDILHIINKLMINTSVSTSPNIPTLKDSLVDESPSDRYDDDLPF